MKQHLALKVPASTDQIGAAVDQVLSHAPPWVDHSALNTGLTEALTNAIVHGVLEVTSSSRGEDFISYLDQVDERSHEPEHAASAVDLSLRYNEKELLVALTWQGKGCPKDRQAPSSVPNPLANSGFGATLIHASCDEVIWSPDGREMSLRYIRRG